MKWFILILILLITACSNVQTVPDKKSVGNDISESYDIPSMDLWNLQYLPYDDAAKPPGLNKMMRLDHCINMSTNNRNRVCKNGADAFVLIMVFDSAENGQKNYNERKSSLMTNKDKVEGYRESNDNCFGAKGMCIEADGFTKSNCGFANTCLRGKVIVEIFGPKLTFEQDKKIIEDNKEFLEKMEDNEKSLPQYQS